MYSLRKKKVHYGQWRRSQSRKTVLADYFEYLSKTRLLWVEFLRILSSKASKNLINLISLILIPFSWNNRQFTKHVKMNFKYLWSLWQWSIKVNYFYSQFFHPSEYSGKWIIICICTCLYKYLIFYSILWFNNLNLRFYIYIYFI